MATFDRDSGGVQGHVTRVTCAAGDTILVDLTATNVNWQRGIVWQATPASGGAAPHVRRAYAQVAGTARPPPDYKRLTVLPCGVAPPE